MSFSIFLSPVFEPATLPDDRYLVPATASPVARGLATGLITAAAVIGLLLGLGHRSGTTWRPLNATAHTILGARADGVWGFHLFVTPMGGAVVLVVSAMAGVVIALLASSRRAFTGVAAAAGVALAGYLLHLHVVARSPGGLAELLSIGELRALYTLAALASAVGIRFAVFGSGGASRE